MSTDAPLESTSDSSQDKNQRLGVPEPLQRLIGEGIANATGALSSWLDSPIELSHLVIEEVELADVGDQLGPGETLVVSCSMHVTGRQSGLIVLIFEDQSGLALSDMILRRPVGTAKSWNELERSAAQETANILGCSFLNHMATQLPDDGQTSSMASGALIPSPPKFRRDFAASLLQGIVMDQATMVDRILLIRSQFRASGAPLAWWLLYVPSGESLAEFRRLTSCLGSDVESG